MGSVAQEYRPAAVERAARGLWTTRGLPRPDGVIGRTATPIVHQLEGAYTAGDNPTLVAFRAVAADIAARYFSIAGRRALGTLRRDEEVTDDRVVNLLRSLSVWTGGEGGEPVDLGERRERIEGILGRMAGRGLVVTRDAPLRICPHCAAPRSPERIIYAEEEGDTYLVRFGLPDGERRLQVLVWVDAPWRLLGASALLVHPDIPYVVARYRRRGVDELILTSRSSLARLVKWLPGAEIDVLEEHPGSHWAGRPYEYPLRAEFPMGADLTPPAGTVQAVPDVGDSGTGIVPLVPGHGGTDAQIAERIGVMGWPLVTNRGQLASTLMHKYAGLDLATASEFVLRDLVDNGVVFAHLRVRRGVPHCASCGTPLVWAPGRAWCLEPSRLPPERRAAYLRLLPRDPPMSQIEVAAWPVSESTSRAPGPRNSTLLECPQCERLEPVGADPECACGGTRRAVSRALLPSIRGILAAWARFDPFPPGDAVWIYLNERRRAPTLTHHLAVMSGVDGAPAEVGLTVLPGGSDAPLDELVGRCGADAVRGALIRAEGAQRAGSTLTARCAQEARKLAQYWQLAHEVLDQVDPALLTAFIRPITGYLSDLEVEDRTVLARWERVRIATLAAYDAQAPAAAYRHLSRFLSNDLPRYRQLVSPRLEPASGAPSRRGALRTLHHLVRETALLLGPIAPHTAEVIYGATTTSGTSLFEATVPPANANLMDEERARAWDRWQSVLEAIDRFRSAFGIPSTTPLPAVAAVVNFEEVAEALRTDRPMIERLARVGRFEAFGPASPWIGRRRELQPVFAEIQKVYPAEASQIVHLLRRQPAHRRESAGAAEDLSVVLQGTSRRILPSMVTYVERLPERFVPTPWHLGEMYLELPPTHPAPSRVPPPLSLDAFRLVERVERDFRQRPVLPGVPRPPLVVATLDPLASDLRRVAPALATYLNVPELRVVDDVREFPLNEATHGRTKTGVRWWLYLPGLPPRTGRLKPQRARSATSRVRPPPPPGEGDAPELDFASPACIAREEQVRALMTELDGVLGAPLLGFAKTAGAWDAGLQSRAAFEAAPFETVAALPGFGWPVAEALVAKFGQPSPRRPRRVASHLDFSPSAAAAPPVVSPNDPVPAGYPSTRRDLAPTRPALTDLPRRSSVPPPDFPIELPGPAPPTAPPSRPDRSLGGPNRRDPAASLTPAAPPAPAGTPQGIPPTSNASSSPPAIPEERAVETLTEGSLPPPIPPADGPQPGGPAAEAGVAGGEIPEVEPAAPTEGFAPRGGPEEPSEPAVPPPAPSELPPFADGSPGPEPELAAPWDRPQDPAAPAPPPAPPELEADDAARGMPRWGDPPSSRAPETLDPLMEEAFSIPAEEAEHVGSDPPRAPPTGAEPPASEVLGPGSPPGEIPPPMLSSPPPAPSDPTGSYVPVPVPEPHEGAASGPAAEPSQVAPALTEPRPAYEASATDPGFPSSDAGSPPQPPAPAPTREPGSSPFPARVPLEPELSSGPEPPPTGPAGALAVPEPSAPVPALPSVPPVSPWGIRLVVSATYLPPLLEFLDMTSAGHRGVAIVRESPERLRTHIGARPAEVYWLTNIGRGLTLKPSDLAAYGAFLEAAVERDRVTAFFLEGVEYLVRLHGVDRVAELLTAFQHRAVAHEARVWVCVHPNLIAPPDLERLIGALGS